MDRNYPGRDIMQPSGRPERQPVRRPVRRPVRKPVRPATRPFADSADSAARTAGADRSDFQRVQRVHKSSGASYKRSSGASRNRSHKIRKDPTLIVFEALGRIASLPVLAFRSFKKAKRYREISLVAFGLFAILAGIWAVSILSRPNALSVYVGDENLGLLRWERGDLDSDYLITHTLTRLQGRYGTEILPAHEIFATPARAGRNAETMNFDTMVSAIENALDFYVYAAVITVNGTVVATLANAERAEALLAEIIAYHAVGWPQNYEFAENVSISTAAIHNSYVEDFAQALANLTTPRVVREIYTVRPGDNLYNIARDFGMTLTALLANNPNIDPNDLLGEGTLLVVTPNVPIISVRPINALSNE